MLFLIENVFSDRVEMRWADAEQAVAILPVEIWNAQCLDKLGRILFENFKTLAAGNFFVSLQRT